MASPRNLGFEAQPVTHGLPQDWEPWGPHSTDYAYSLDQENKVSGTVSARIEFKAMSYRGQGGYVQCAEANDYAGKRLKLTGSHKTMNATQRKGVRVWLRAFGPENRYYYQGSSVGASDASDSILGTTIWATRSARIDVPHDAEAVCYGALLDGRGVMWVDDLRLVAEKVES